MYKAEFTCAIDSFCQIFITQAFQDIEVLNKIKLLKNEFELFDCIFTVCENKKVSHGTYVERCKLLLKL